MPYSSLLHPAIPKSAAPRSPTPVAVHCCPIPSQETLKQFCLSLYGIFGSQCAQGLFEPSEPVCQVWGLILNKISPILVSCWGFSFALGHGISPQSCSSMGQPPLQHCAAELKDDAVKTLKDDAVKVLHSICQQIWKTQQWPQDWKRSIFIPIPKKGNAKERSNYPTLVFISHTSKVMLKILQARLQ